MSSASTSLITTREEAPPRELKLPLDSELRAEMVRRIRQVVPDCCIVAFGSRIYGAHEDSDLDLLVIVDTDRCVFVVAGQIYSAMRGRHFALDVVAMTPDDIRQRLRSFDPFLEEVLSRGEVWHGRFSRPTRGGSSKQKAIEG